MIDQKVTDAQPRIEEANHDAINRILGVAETTLLGVAVDHQLHGISVERWRWDQPEIVMSWSPVRENLDLGKNIRVFVAVSDSIRIRCSVASNVWLDEPQPDGSIIRHWGNFSDSAHEIGDPGNLTQVETRWLNNQIERAYDRIADGSEFVLSHAVRIFPDGRSQPIDAPLRIANGIVSNQIQETKI